MGYCLGLVWLEVVLHFWPSGFLALGFQNAGLCQAYRIWVGSESPFSRVSVSTPEVGKVVDEDMQLYAVGCQSYGALLEVPGTIQLPDIQYPRLRVGATGFEGHIVQDTARG